MTLLPDVPVRHARLGQGQVLFVQGDVAYVRFEHGVEGCPTTELRPLRGVADRIAAGEADAGLPTLLRAIALAIRSVNDTWGVFSCSRVQLLPHQLWVCRQVLSSWPTHWLVADDVGLGKTIEAGLILTPLISSARVKRLLILTPASLTGQWQERLRELFDIRTQIYTQEADTPRAKWWSTANLVVASAHTLRLDKNGRWLRILEAEPWDMVMVDEAHHLYRSNQGDTLGYKLIQQLVDAGKARSMVFFTGTPHRGDDRAFLSLLSLLRPDLIDPKRPVGAQLHSLREVMIRNNKQRVTDMAGHSLFQPVRSRFEEVRHQPAEAAFYAELTWFIRSGEAYANQLSRIEAQAVELVLTAMQKLASSSIAAISRAIRGRVARLEKGAQAMERLEEEARRCAEAGIMTEEDNDRIAEIHEQLMVATHNFRLTPEELPALRRLMELANAVFVESKLIRVMELLDGPLADRTVLIFTEYKATQSMLYAALERRFGSGCVTFINGEGRLIELPGQPGREVRELREVAARRFREGQARFLVSTEAAGEGIDLQDRCHTLIHFDLPWNPMRMHQRVGRLYRYGQTETVDVVSIRNPDTVEDHIWSLLDEKLKRITRAFQGGMDDPEDMRQIVLGLSSPGEIDRVFAEALRQTPERLDAWFDARTAKLGGEEAVAAVRRIFGSVARFDFGQVGRHLPKVDLSDLEPFLRAALRLESRRVETDPQGRLAFLAPKSWQKEDFAVAERYQRVSFDRQDRRAHGESVDLMGCGHRLIDVALRSMEAREESFTYIAGLDAPVFVFALRDAVTLDRGGPSRVVVGLQLTKSGPVLLRDWELVLQLNPFLERASQGAGEARRPAGPPVPAPLEEIEHALHAALSSLDLPFRSLRTELTAAFFPSFPSRPGESASGQRGPAV